MDPTSITTLNHPNNLTQGSTGATASGYTLANLYIPTTATITAPDSNRQFR